MEDTSKMEQKKLKRLAFYRRLSLIALILSCLCLVLFAFFYIRENVLLPQPYNTPPALQPTPTPTATPMETEAPTPTPYVKLDPIHIYFPKQKADMPIEAVGTDDKGRMATIDSPLVAAWYQNGPAPGDEGNALLNGHVRWKGVAGTFSVIKKMELYDPILTLHEDGSLRVFYVTEIKVIQLDDAEAAAEVMDLNIDKRVTLITCDGEFDRSLGTSVNRYVVYAKLEEDIEDFDPSYRYGD